MSETRCIFVASDQPRMLAHRHADDCEDDRCRGCQPCTEAHCGMCAKTHLDVANHLHCPECVGAVREDMTEVRDLCIHLRERALMGSNGHGRRFASMRLLGGDPAVLVGPVSDGHVDQLLRWRVHDPESPDADIAGWRDATDDERIPSLELLSDPMPPLLWLGRWENAWRDWLDLPSEAKATIGSALAFLFQHLTYMAQVLDRRGPNGLEFAPDFGEFARDMRALRRHLEDQLADGEREEVTRVPCRTCGSRLVKVYGKWESDDHHVCPCCKRKYNDDEFARARTMAGRSDGSDAWILLADAAKSIDRSPHTLRTWVAAGKVRVDREYIEGVGGVMTRVYVWWPDVRHADAASGRRSRSAWRPSDILSALGPPRPDSPRP